MAISHAATRFVSALTIFGVLVSSNSLAQSNVFFGNLHSHTDYSDGVKKPRDAYRHARNKAKIDFLLISEHNHDKAGEIADDTELYTGPGSASLVPRAGLEMRVDKFVALYGQEFSKIGYGNHINVFDVPEVIDVAAGRFDKLVEWIEQPNHLDTDGRPALLQFNHPWARDSQAHQEYGRDDSSSKAEWISTMDRHVQLIEVINGPAKTKSTGIRPAHIKPTHYFDYLNEGFHLAPTSNQDNHRVTWGNATTARTGVIADVLTKTAIMNALRARHVFASTDTNLEVIATINGNLMGDIVSALPNVGDELNIELSIFDPDEPDAEYDIEVFEDSGPGGNRAKVTEIFEHEGNTANGTIIALDGITFAGSGHYIFLEITQFDEFDDDTDKLWTAPIWFEAAGSTPNSCSGPRLVSLMPNSAAPERQTESVTLRNNTAASINMSGWTLQDITGKTWLLDSLGTMSPDQEKTIVRNGQAMSLNNGGDTISLVSPTNCESQVFSYGKVAEGVSINVP